MYKKDCDLCGKEFYSAGPAGRYCPECKDVAVERQREKNKIRAEKRRRANGSRIGRGAPSGAEHPNYRHGFYVAQTQSSKYRASTDGCCERCKKDLSQVNRWHWVVHHKDHNHSNHEWDNLELLCKTCHATEHNVIDNLKVQRPSRKGVGPSGPKRETSLADDDMV